MGGTPAARGARYRSHPASLRGADRSHACRQLSVTRVSIMVFFRLSNLPGPSPRRRSRQCPNSRPSPGRAGLTGPDKRDLREAVGIRRSQRVFCRAPEPSGAGQTRSSCAILPAEPRLATFPGTQPVNQCAGNFWFGSIFGPSPLRWRATEIRSGGIATIAQAATYVRPDLGSDKLACRPRAQPRRPGRRESPSQRPAGLPQWRSGARLASAAYWSSVPNRL
jgi:hypothetical protein